MTDTTTDHAPEDRRVRDEDYRRDERLHGEDEARFDRGGRTAWGAIIAGAVVALAVFNLLSLLGLGIGGATVAPETSSPLNGVITGSAIWIVVSQLLALFAGGFVAGRLAGKLHRIGAILHGIAVWAVATIVTFWLAASATTGFFSIAGQTVSSAVQGSASAVQAAVPDNFSMPNVLTSQLNFNNLPQPLQQKLRQNGITPQNFQAETRDALRNVVSQQEQRQARQELRQTAVELIRSPGDAQRDVNDLRNEMFGGQDAVLSEQDKQEAYGVLEQRFGLSRQEAQQFVQTVEERAQAAQNQAAQTVQQAQQQARQTADTAANTLSRAGFGGFVASLVGLLAAAGGAFLGTPGRRSDQPA